MAPIPRNMELSQKRPAHRLLYSIENNNHFSSALLNAYLGLDIGKGDILCKERFNTTLRTQKHNAFIEFYNMSWLNTLELEFATMATASNDDHYAQFPSVLFKLLCPQRIYRSSNPDQMKSFSHFIVHIMYGYWTHCSYDDTDLN